MSRRVIEGVIDTSHLKQSDVNEILDRVILLEAKLGGLVKKIPMTPFAVRANCSQIIAVQYAASQVAKYLGLADLLFAVRIATQTKDVAGKIHINRESQLVEIELDPNIFLFEAAVIATICHEITHRILYRYGIRDEESLRNEKLTDTAAVYLGLGSFMLNGCSCFSTSVSRTGSTTTTHTTKLSSGYLTQAEFAATYCLVAKLHNTPRPDFLAPLSSNSLIAVQLLEKELPDFANNNEIADRSNINNLEIITNEISSIQKEDLEVERGVRSLRAALRNLDDLRRPMHVMLRDQQQQLIINTTESNQSLAFLRTAKAIYTLRAERSEVDPFIARSLETANIALNSKTASVFSSDYAVICCPIEGTQMRVPSGKALVNVTCPRCSYRFLTTTLSARTQSDVPSKPNDNHKVKFLKRMKKLLKFWGR